MSSARFYSLWAINEDVEFGLLRRQIDEIKSLGFDGLVFHPRFYPNYPPYLSDEYLDIVSDLILHAKSIGMEFWIYDENGWPSGTVSGQLLKKYPEDAQWRIDAVQSKPGGFEYVPRKCAGVDYLNPDLAKHILKRP